MKTHYLIPTAMMPPDAYGGPSLVIDGVQTFFCHPKNQPWLLTETHSANAYSLMSIDWSGTPNNWDMEAAFEATPGVVVIPPIWDQTAAAPPEALVFFDGELPQATKAASSPTFDALRKALPRARQHGLLPW